VWINSYIAQESSIFDEAADKGYLLKRTDGSVWQYDFWVCPSLDMLLSHR
jgi:alpha-D-xyloside xylohydrolase